jgi:hypothetical protein
MAAKKIFWDWANGDILISDQSPALVPDGFWDFYKYSRIPFVIVPVERCFPWGLGNYSRTDITGLTLKASAFSTLNTSTPEAEQATWTKDSTLGVMTFTGYLDLNTTPFNNAVAAADTPSGTIKFQLELSDSGGIIGRVRKNIIVKQGTAIATTSPDPLIRYLTMAEAEGLFAKLNNRAGETMTFVSPDGTITRVIGIRNDGTPMDDVQ